METLKDKGLHKNIRDEITTLDGIKWCAPEIITGVNISQKSDVYR
jgi:hypothetical protein